MIASGETTNSLHRFFKYCAIILLFLSGCQSPDPVNLSSIDLLRTWIKFAKIQGNIGPHKERIDQTKVFASRSVSVEGYPDANIFFISPIERADDMPVLIYIHGGGWSLGNAKSVEWFTKLISSYGFIVANIDYSLAPEFPYPASTIQLVAVLNYIYENAEQYGIDRNNILIGGNSAGAHLASQLGALVTNNKYAEKVGVKIEVPENSLRGLILINGVYNFQTVGACNFPFFEDLAWAYTGQIDYLNYSRLSELSTLEYVNEKFPASFITAGNSDPVKPETIALIQKLLTEGVNVTSVLWDKYNVNLDHDYIYNQNTIEAQIALESAILFMKERESRK